MVHLVQILLPLADNDGQSFPARMYRSVQRELTGRFGGLTAFTRAPAEGHWLENDQVPCHDDIVVFEVMVEQLDHDWWRYFRATMERDFRQDSIMIRALRMTRI